MSRGSRTNTAYVRFVREDDFVKDLCISGNYDQALKNVNKRRLKKEPKSMHFMLIKACLLFCKDDVEDSHSICLELLPPEMGGAFAYSPFSNILCLHHLYYDSATWLRKLDRARLSALWKAAIEAKPSPENKNVLAKDWVEQMMARSDWTSVEQAAKALPTLMPGGDSANSQYYFWRVVAQWLSKPQGPSAEDPRFQKLGRQMALKLLENSAKQTRIKGQVAPPISKPAEYDLMIELYLRENRGKDLRTLMESTMLKEKSTLQEQISQHELRWKYSKRLPVDHFWEPNQEILQFATHGTAQYRADDYNQWLGLIHSAKTEEKQQITNSLIDKALVWNPKLRSVRLASMTVKREEPLVSMLSNYFADFGHLSPCAKDMIGLADQLTVREFSNLLNEIDYMHKDAPVDTQNEIQSVVTRETNVLYLGWHLHTRFCQHDESKSRSEGALESFTRTCLRTYQWSHDERVGLLTVRAILQRYNRSKCPHQLVQTFCFLQLLVERHNSDSDIAIASISCLRLYGFLDEAFDSFCFLNIKGILIHTCAPLMFTRAGLMQPWMIGHKERRTGLGVLEDFLDFFHDEPAKITRYQTLALENENHIQAIQFEELKSTIKTSATRRLLRAERRAMLWLSENANVFGGLPPPDFQELPSVISARQYELPILAELDVTPAYLHYVEYISYAVEFCLRFRGSIFPPSHVEWLQRKRSLAHVGKDKLLDVEQAGLAVIDQFVKTLTTTTDEEDVSSGLNGAYNALDKLEGLIPLDRNSVTINPGIIPLGADYHAIYTAFWLTLGCNGLCFNIQTQNKSKPSQRFSERLDSLCKTGQLRLRRLVHSAIELSKSWLAALEETRSQRELLFFGPDEERDKDVDPVDDLGKIIMYEVLGEKMAMRILDQMISCAQKEMRKVEHLQVVTDNLLRSKRQKGAQK
ncbi:MAG: hypothetical protein M1831_006742 [Alyxoria varia]|nr:MAG: hypothetical protein M1831_006742 [Alyxoria varia]